MQCLVFGYLLEYINTQVIVIQLNTCNFSYDNVQIYTLTPPIISFILTTRVSKNLQAVCNNNRNALFHRVLQIRLHLWCVSFNILLAINVDDDAPRVYTI